MKPLMFAVLVLGVFAGTILREFAEPGTINRVIYTIQAQLPF